MIEKSSEIAHKLMGCTHRVRPISLCASGGKSEAKERQSVH